MLLLSTGRVLSVADNEGDCSLHVPMITRYSMGLSFASTTTGVP
jgi:hypothetical protein